MSDFDSGNCVNCVSLDVNLYEKEGKIIGPLNLQLSVGQTQVKIMQGGMSVPWEGVGCSRGMGVPGGIGVPGEWEFQGDWCSRGLNVPGGYVCSWGWVSRGMEVP